MISYVETRKRKRGFLCDILFLTSMGAMTSTGRC